MVLLLALVVLLAACSASPDKPPFRGELIINGLSIYNRTQAYVSAAQLMVPQTGAFVSCGAIAPGAVCATGFPEQEFSGWPVEMTWSQAGRIHSTGQITITPGEEVVEAGEAIVQISIVGPGSAGVELLAVERP